MAEIIHFIPRAELDAIENLNGFIEGCRDQLTVLGADLDWNSNDWDVTEYLPRRGRNGRLAFAFTNFETAGQRGETVPMAQPFLDFAKAYMRYQHSMKTTKSFGGRLVALRALEKALTELSGDGIPRVERIDPHVLNYTVQLIKKRTPGSVYQVANQLKSIVELILRFRFTVVAFTWKNPVRKPEDLNITIGDKAEARRQAKLPAKDAIETLAKA